MTRNQGCSLCAEWFRVNVRDDGVSPRQQGEALRRGRLQAVRSSLKVEMGADAVDAAAGRNCGTHCEASCESWRGMLTGRVM